MIAGCGGKEAKSEGAVLCCSRFELSRGMARYGEQGMILGIGVLFR